MPKSAKRLAAEIDEVWATADREERELTHAERRDLAAKIEAAFRPVTELNTVREG